MNPARSSLQKYLAAVALLPLFVFHATACSSSTDDARPAPQSPAALDSLFTVNGRLVAANVGGAPRESGVEIIADEAGHAAIVQAVNGVLELAEERVREVDITQSLLIVAYDDICRPGAAVLEIEADSVTVVHRDVGYGCTSPTYHYSVFELPHSYGFDAENLPIVKVRVDGL